MVSNCRAGLIVALLLLLMPPGSHAQTRGRVPSLCFLTFDPGTLETGSTGRYKPFFQGLRAHGYVHPKTITVHYLSADSQNERFPALAAECIRLRSDVIVAATTPAALAAKKATSTVPIVMHPLGDPVGTGLVKSLSQPGGNVTGLTFMSPGIAAKRLEILKEAFPNISRVLVLTYLTDPIARGQLDEIAKVAPKLGVTLILRDIKTADDYPPAFATGLKEGADALFVTSESISSVNRAAIVGLANKHRLPAVYWGLQFIEAGGVLAYTSAVPDFAARTAYFVDRVLKGAKPADLPIEQPATYALIVNLQAAKTLGLTIPASIQMRADKIVQ